MSAPYMPLFVADYLADTAHLSAAEHGAYLLLIMNYWQRRKPLPNDDRKLARIVRMTDDEWADARGNISEFFQISDDGWAHARIENEINIADGKSAKAKASARASVEARSANAQRTLSVRSTNAELLGEERKDNNSLRSLLPEREEKNGFEKKAIAKDATLSGENLEIAITHGLRSDQATAEWQKFKAWHLSEGKKSADWDAAWSLWVSRRPVQPSVETRQFGSKSPVLNVVPAIDRDVETVPGKVWIKADTPEWDRAVQRLGKKPPNIGGGWYFDKDILGSAVSH